MATSPSTMKPEHVHVERFIVDKLTQRFKIRKSNSTYEIPFDGVINAKERVENTSGFYRRRFSVGDVPPRLPSVDRLKNLVNRQTPTLDAYTDRKLKTAPPKPPRLSITSQSSNAPTNTDTKRQRSVTTLCYCYPSIELSEEHVYCDPFYTGIMDSSDDEPVYAVLEPETISKPFKKQFYGDMINHSRSCSLSPFNEVVQESTWF